ncbi:5-formyltetrahydrofolate cyclo-ligase [Rhodococcus spelaei]|uniref:5-formyltetrahydrofolate cyclo-ligase n=1 Tax=Rhodococcus spelaei TaxID=2546320 RepID=A0A541BNY0_9NOCA|nr:5-formyltetrahydrofolate cyclo-ligase [Rhodococcus spelaei]TQF74041.1 5-formyltetrahydrofolate cyclo-ligase [Rhodococcus spelaei]
MDSPGRTPSAPALTKSQWRERVLAARRTLDPDVRAAEDRAVAAAAHDLGTTAGASATVCAYVPVGREPGSIEMVESLSLVVGRVLLPVAGAPGPLQWAPYRGRDALVRASFGLLEPARPHLPPEAVAEAALVLVPALAVDRRGVRLGRGAGFYDRSLALADPGARLIAVVRDDELVDQLPEDPHDIRMGEALTPARGVQLLR